MIVWIDGANGVGKSHVAAELADAFIDKNAEYVESYSCWVELIKEILQRHFLDLIHILISIFWKN